MVIGLLKFELRIWPFARVALLPPVSHRLRLRFRERPPWLCDRLHYLSTYAGNRRASGRDDLQQKI